MTIRELLRARLHFQGLESPVFKTPADMIRYFGAVQAQDFFGSLWAVGQRVAGATETTVEAALNEGKIVRSWPMRGTLHLTAPEDLRWMLDLLGPRAMAKSVSYQRGMGLTKKDFVKSRSIFERELQKKTLDRNEIYQVLEDKGVDTANTRGLHIIGQMAREKVICFGPRKGKQPTFVLLDEWIPNSKKLSQEESLAELSLRYFTSHGPATVHDFAWWSGLTVTDAARGLDMVQSKLRQDENCWMPKEKFKMNGKLFVRLLPAYDEFLVAYKQRDDMRSIFSPAVVVNGRVVGTWKRTLSKKGVKLDVKSSDKSVSKAALQTQLKRYADFIGYIRL